MADATIPHDRAPPPVDRPPHRDPASATLGIGLSIVATILGLILLAWLILYVTKGRFLKPHFERFVSTYMERTVRVKGDFQLYFDPIDVKFLAEGMTISNPAWASKPNLFASRLIDTRIETIPLIFGKRNVEWLALVDGDVDLEWNKAHTRNTWTLSETGEPFEIPLIRRAAVTGTTLRYRDPSMQLATDIRFDTIRAGGNRFQNAIRFAGDGTMRGNRFTVAGGLGSPNETMAGGKVQFDLHANAAATRLDVAGTLPGVTQFEGSDLNLQVRGRNIRDLFDLVGIAVPDTRAYRIRSHLTKAGDEWRFTRLVGNYGQSDIAGRMTISMPNDRLLLVADLASRKVDIIDIGPFIGYEPNALATKSVTAAVRQTGGTPRILPDAPLRAEAIKAFDARVNYKVRVIRAPNVPISNVALTLNLDRSLLKLSPLTFDMAGGYVASDIEVNARGQPVATKYDIRLSPTPMGKLLKGWGVEESGTSGTLAARVKMTGEGDTVRESLASSDGRIAVVLPRGTFWTRNIQLAEFDIGVFVQKLVQDKLKKPVQINCGLIAFTVRDGIAAADPVLIDTDKNVMAAKGGFSFKDESLNIDFRADAKKFSLFSGQSPVGIGGYFAAPALQIVSPQLIARGGAGLALGMVASPLAAVLAFVDFGDAKDTACGPVLAGATAAQQRTVKGERRKDVGTRAENQAEARGERGEKKDKKILGIF